MITQFVTRSGSQLLYQGQPFRFAGCNMYWLGLSQDPTVRYPTHAEIDAAFDDAVTMHLTVVRTLACESVGIPLSIEPSLGVWNDAAFEPIDYALQSAAAHGLRLIFPLVDNNVVFLGGKFSYLAFHGWTPALDPQGLQFFTNPMFIGDFEAHIQRVLNHVNQYTGIQYLNDPTILAWETGNEMASSASVSAWSGTIATYIRALGAQQLIADGSLNQDATGLAHPLLDLFSMHCYDNTNTPTLASTRATAAAAAGKAFFVGEYTWTGFLADGVTPISWGVTNMITAVEGNTAIAGDLFWEILPGWVTHNDGYTFYFPGTTAAMLQAGRVLLAHGARTVGMPTTPDSTNALPLIDQTFFERADLIYSSEVPTYFVASSAGPGSGAGTGHYDGQNPLNVYGDRLASQQLLTQALIPIVRVKTRSPFTDMANPNGGFGLLPRTEFMNYINAIRLNCGAYPMVVLPIITSTEATWTNAQLLTIDQAIIAQAGPLVQLYEFGNEWGNAHGNTGAWSPANSGASIAAVWLAVAPQLVKYARSLGFEILLGGPADTSSNIDLVGDATDTGKATAFFTAIMTAYNTPSNIYYHDPDVLPKFYSNHLYGVEFHTNTGQIVTNAYQYYGTLYTNIRNTINATCGLTIGPKIPIINSEWNVDIDGGDFTNAAAFYTGILAQFRTSKVAAACQFLASGNNTGVDMFALDGSTHTTYYTSFKNASLADPGRTINPFAPHIDPLRFKQQLLAMAADPTDMQGAKSAAAIKAAILSDIAQALANSSS